MKRTREEFEEKNKIRKKIQKLKGTFHFGRYSFSNIMKDAGVDT